jgi:hypothetical protein
VVVNQTIIIVEQDNGVTIYKTVYKPDKGRPMYALYALLAVIVLGILIFLVMSLIKGGNY